MSGIIHNCEQGTPEWYACRLGIPSASEFSTVLALGKNGGESVGRRKYMLQLIGERLTGKPMESYSNGHIERGKEMEEEARQLYSLVCDAATERIGFIRHDEVACGASPDSLVGDDGLLEIKTKQPDRQLECLLRREKFTGNRIVPPEHADQLQGQLYVSGRQWVDFVSYWPGLPLFVHRVYRDEAEIAKIDSGVRSFLIELEALMRKVQ